MSNIFSAFRDRICAIVSDLAQRGTLPAGLDTRAVTAEPPRDPAHGDVATNVALVLAGQAKRKPRDIAEAVAAELAAEETVSAVEVAGPGFINLRLTEAFWHAHLADLLTAGATYGDSGLGAGRRVNVEYVSVNPTGPLHVGHARGAVYGDALSSLLEKAGYDVTREYYINDAGAQIDKLAYAAYWRYLEALGKRAPGGALEAFLGDVELEYRGAYLVAVGEALAEKYGIQLVDAAVSEWLPKVCDFAIEAMMVLIRDDLDALGVHQEVFTSERALVAKGRVESAFKLLEAKGLLYTGTLDPPKGMKPGDWEARPQTLFRSTDFGDDVDRPLRKSDGSWTYFAPDIANHLDKIERGFDTLIDVWGADHGGYVKRMKAA
ncbi:MAG: arginine--tRNA ligase, partial [Alphaproteobacteria bacterium]